GPRPAGYEPAGAGWSFCQSRPKQARVASGGSSPQGYSRLSGPRAANSHWASLGNDTGRPHSSASQEQNAWAPFQLMPTTGWSGEEKRRSRQYLGSSVPVLSRNTAYCALVTGVSPSQNGETRTGCGGCSSRYWVPPITNRPPGIHTNRMCVEGSTRVPRVPGVPRLPTSPGSNARSLVGASTPARAWLSSATALAERPPGRSTEVVTLRYSGGSGRPPSALSPASTIGQRLRAKSLRQLAISRSSQG